MKTQKELLADLNKDVISTKICLIDERTEAYYLHTTDHYFLRDTFAEGGLAVGYELTYGDLKFKVAEIAFDFMTGGLCGLKPPEENTRGVFNPYSLIVNIYVKKLD